MDLLAFLLPQKCKMFHINEKDPHKTSSKCHELGLVKGHFAANLAKMADIHKGSCLGTPLVSARLAIKGSPLTLYKSKNMFYPINVGL